MYIRMKMHSFQVNTCLLNATGAGYCTTSRPVYEVVIVSSHIYLTPCQMPCVAPLSCQAPDVRAAFKDVARTYGGRSDAAAESWLGGLLESNR